MEADDPVAPDSGQRWDEVKSDITLATDKFRTTIAGLDADQHTPGSWTGATQNATVQNLKGSYSTLDSIGAGAETLGILTQAFSNTMSTTRNDIVSNFQTYQDSVEGFPEARDYIYDTYNKFARAVMIQAYQPNIVDIAGKHPSFDNSGASINPNVNSNLPPGTAGLNGTGGGAGSGPGAVGAPNIPVNPNTPTIPTDPNAGPSSPSSGLPYAGELAELAQQGLTTASQAASQAASQLGQLAQRVGNPGALSGPNIPHGVPHEGALSLGPGSMKSPLGKAGGAGGSTRAPDPSIGKPASAPATAAGRTADRTVAAGSRAGLGSVARSAGAGMPGAGAPAAGHHGGAQGAPYQPNKALRRKKNGEELVGNAEAVPAVLGESARKEAAKPEA
ncbi:MAG: hypothetical protein J2P17_06500, partial [Mycobacterium sp.]|nr:hypothetical protein [Mycobacterium sp.]